MIETAVRHLVIARAFDRFCRLMEREVGEHRAEHAHARRDPRQPRHPTVEIDVFKLRTPSAGVVFTSSLTGPAESA